MAEILGTLVGTLLAASPPKQPPAANAGGGVRLLRFDTAELNAAAVADYIDLGTFRWDTVLTPESTYYYDACGAGVTISIGDVTYPAALASAASVSSAGSRSALASVDIANYGKPLWQLLGYASLAAAKLVGSVGCQLRAKVAAASTTATGTFSWCLRGVEK